MLMNLCIFVLSAFCSFLDLAKASEDYHHVHHHPIQAVLADEEPSILESDVDRDPMSYKFDTYVESDPTAPWDYNTVRGPLHWSQIKDADGKIKWPKCRGERGQSPINIQVDTPGIGLSDRCNIWPGRLTSSFIMVNNETEKTIKLGPFPPEPFNSLGFRLIDIHFHTPSEHRFEDVHYPVEAHFVLKNAQGRLTVRGIFFDVFDSQDARQSDFLAGISSALDWIIEPNAQTLVHGVNTRNIMRIFEHECRTHPKSRVYHYTGSLTTPPCNTSVSWHVLSQPLPISVSTYKKLRQMMKFNARYTQNEPPGFNILGKACGDHLP